jgi:AraC-like DNA-binding protein
MARLNGVIQLLYPKITLAHTFHAPNEWGMPMRVLKQHQFQFTLSGKVRYLFPNYGEIFLGKFDLLHIPPYMAHEITVLTDEPYVCYSIVFHFGEHMGHDEAIWFSEQPTIERFSEPVMDHCLTQLILNHQLQSSAHSLIAQGFLLQAIGLMLERSQGNPQGRNRSRNLSKLVLIQNYLIEHFHQEITLSVLEQRSGWSRNHIINQFKQHFGMTPSSYVTKLRIEKAKELALTTEYSYGEIANKVGFSDVHTLGKMFKMKTGMSLSQFCTTIVTQRLTP